MITSMLAQLEHESNFLMRMSHEANVLFREGVARSDEVV